MPRSSRWPAFGEFSCPSFPPNNGLQSKRASRCLFNLQTRVSETHERYFYFPNPERRLFGMRPLGTGDELGQAAKTDFFCSSLCLLKGLLLLVPCQLPSVSLGTDNPKSKHHPPSHPLCLKTKSKKASARMKIKLEIGITVRTS